MSQSAVIGLVCLISFILFIAKDFMSKPNRASAKDTTASRLLQPRTFGAMLLLFGVYLFIPLTGLLANITAGESYASILETVNVATIVVVFLFIAIYSILFIDMVIIQTPMAAYKAAISPWTRAKK